ncbi:ricin-type beta-trefoil lectin domain protein [Micromonospora sp. NPDC023956]|uniref:ricin-type beta-trefoil lectin domain protein n=1 Tax=Micromonospora sp. NPDC023956 TaxID=3155722 RepID=UPI0033E7460F
MTSVSPSARSPLGRIPRRLAAGLVAGLAVLSAVVAAVGWGVASAEDDDLVGRPVSDELAATVVAAARSCPVLSPARLAGQLMAESGLDSRARDTASGGRGIAGLDDQDWKKWAPWPDAARSDATANTIALAHQLCDLSGQLRLKKVDGDAWRLSVAAFHTGLDDVVRAGQVPPPAVEYVDEVSAYAAYYGKLTVFGGSGDVRPTGGKEQPKAVPAEYVPLVVRAGSVCPQVSPPAVAAQLMALSGFDPNRLGPSGQRGVAQFLPEVWQAYGPDGVSAWEPEVAVPAVGSAMCAMVKDLGGLAGDPYLLALAAYRNGPTAVRQTGGELDSATEAFVRTVREFTDFYTLDGRLRPAAPPTPTPSAPAPKPTDDAPTPTPSASSKAPPTKRPAPVDPGPQRPSTMKQLVGKETGLCVSAGAGTDGTVLTLRPCREEKAQWWDFRADGTIRANGLCMDVAWGDKQDGTPVQVARCSGNPAQQWRRSPEGGIVSTHSNTCLDVDGHGTGAPLNIWYCVFNPKQTWSLR